MLATQFTYTKNFNVINLCLKKYIYPLAMYSNFISGLKYNVNNYQTSVIEIV